MFIKSSSKHFLNYNKTKFFLWDNLQVKQLRDTKNKAMKYEIHKVSTTVSLWIDFEHELEVTRKIRSPHTDKLLMWGKRISKFNFYLV